MQKTANRFDGIICRALWVTPDPVVDDIQGEESKKLIGASLMISAVRCTLQYAVLPFVLPLIGMAAGWALGITMLISGAAMVAIITSLRRMWKTNYTHRYRYLAIAIPAFLVLAVFFTLDIISILNGGA